MTPDITQCNEVVTPFGIFLVFAVVVVSLIVIGLAVPWFGVAFERYMDWVAKKTGGYRG